MSHLRGWVWRRGITCCQTSKLTLSVSEKSVWQREMYGGSVVIYAQRRRSGSEGDADWPSAVKAGEGLVARRCPSSVGEKTSRGVNPSRLLLLRFFFYYYLFYPSCIVGSVPSAVDVDAAASFALDLSSTSRLVAGFAVSFCFIHLRFPIVQTAALFIFSRYYKC